MKDNKLLAKVSTMNNKLSLCPFRTLTRTATCENILRTADAVLTMVRITVHEVV